MEDKDKIIASLRRQLSKSESKCSALEQEVELLKYMMKKKGIFAHDISNH